MPVTLLDHRGYPWREEPTERVISFVQGDATTGWCPEDIGILKWDFAMLEEGGACSVECMHNEAEPIL